MELAAASGGVKWMRRMSWSSVGEPGQPGGPGAGVHDEAAALEAAARAASMDYYDGSRVFSWLADLSGLPIDQVNFLITQFLALALAPLFRGSLHPKRTSAALRHAAALGLGLFFGYFCFGDQAIHLAGLPAVCYVVMRFQDPKIMQKAVLAVALFYLSCIHLHRQIYDYGSYTLDITGPLMVITQKVTSLAFSLHDGLTQKEEDLTGVRKYHALRKMPTVLEYFAYMFHFQALMAGPIIFYRDYIEFIHGQNFLTHSGASINGEGNTYAEKEVVLEPSPLLAVMRKVVASLVYAILLTKFLAVFPIRIIKEPDFIELDVPSKMLFLMVATAVHRFKYYHAWLLADAICNASGLGFSGYAKDGTPQWDLHSNIDILGFECGLNLRDCIEHWNKGTNRWLRLIVYDRVKTNATALTYALSAFWHGFYPGYYLTFASGALFTFAARKIRRHMRPFFTTSIALKALYDLLTFWTTRVTMAYITFSFILLEFWPSVRCYLSMYLYLHLLAVFALVALPRLLPQPSQAKAKLSDQFMTKSKFNGLKIE